jgi:pyruvate formate-lyase/glycerol dehydratase family glycyl radical enzyme
MSNATADKPLHLVTETGEDWGVGGAGVVDNPSPFPRVNALRQRYFDTEFTIAAERAALVTEAYQAHESDPQPIKVAHAFAHILRHCTIDIDGPELVVGNYAAPAKACPIFPEFSYEWIVDELHNQPFRERPHNRYAHSQETDEKLLGLRDYWRGKTVSDRILSLLSEEETKGASIGGLGVYALDLCTQGGVGHVIPHYRRVFELGWLGLRQQVQAKLDALDFTRPENLDKRLFYRAQLITIEANMDFCRRYAALARQQAGPAVDERRDELLKIAENCEWVAEQPPRSFWEALQLGTFIINNVLIESNGHSVSFGRFDQNMYPYYQRDIAASVITQDFAQELIESCMIKFCGYMKLRDWQTTQGNSGRGIGGLTLTLGGVDSAGRDATNTLSHMCLEALAHTQMPQPWVTVRLHENTPDAFMSKVARVIKIGFGEPKVLNDRVIIPAMLARGRTRADARDYSTVGLVESDVAGCEYSWHDGAYFNLARVLELALNDGRPIGQPDAERIGPATGSLADFQSFEALQEAFEQQMTYWVERMVCGVNVMDLAHQALKPLPYLSLLVEDCIERGVDVTAGGARYNFTGVQAVGVASVADSLAAIKQLVFDQRKTTGRELLEALAADWVGFDYLYALINGRKVHHYGNDDAYADELARYVVDIWCRNVADRPNAHGGVFQPGAFSVSSNVPFGAGLAATPDGRKAGEPISDGISPVHTLGGSHDFKGLTARIKSAASLDQEKLSNGVLTNLKISPDALRGSHADANLTALIKAYFRQGGMHLQMSVASRETLEEANEQPDKYKGLMVYVTGYSALWEDLGEDLKQDIIARTELGFDDNTDLTPPD